ncbi:DKNYY domain-containing protein [Candidatus Gracilibacteria bacterium]|nr:DKNYY domain-containing protein [Candidatus Gracilibacteria bacterium]
MFEIHDNQPGKKELMKLLDSINIDGITSVEFLYAKGGGFSIKTANMKKLALLFTEKYGRTTFLSGELREIFNFVSDNIETTISSEDFNLIKTKMEEFVKYGGVVKINKRTISHDKKIVFHPLRWIKNVIYFFTGILLIYLLGNYLLSEASYKHIIGDIYLNTHSNKVSLRHTYTTKSESKLYTDTLDILYGVDSKTFGLISGSSMENGIGYFKDKNYVYYINIKDVYFIWQNKGAYGIKIYGADPSSVSVIDSTTIQDSSGIYRYNDTTKDFIKL